MSSICLNVQLFREKASSYTDQHVRGVHPQKHPARNRVTILLLLNVPDLKFILIVAMASKLLCLVAIVLNLIKEGVFDCAYPARSNHGVGYIIGSEETRTVLPLEEGEQFYFACQVGWILSYDS